MSPHPPPRYRKRYLTLGASRELLSHTGGYSLGAMQIQPVDIRTAKEVGVLIERQRSSRLRQRIVSPSPTVHAALWLDQTHATPPPFHA